MKKVSILVMVIVSMLFATVSFAKDVVLEKKISSIVFKKDKNGNEYARAFVSEKAHLNGIEYNKEVPVMAFGDTAKKMKGYKKGSTIKVVASEGEYKGSKNYQVLDVIK